MSSWCSEDTGSYTRKPPVCQRLGEAGCLPVTDSLSLTWLPSKADPEDLLLPPPSKFTGWDKGAPCNIPQKNSPAKPTDVSSRDYTVSTSE